MLSVTLFEILHMCHDLDLSGLHNLFQTVAIGLCLWELGSTARHVGTFVVIIQKFAWRRNSPGSTFLNFLLILM